MEENHSYCALSTLFKQKFEDLNIVASVKNVEGFSKERRAKFKFIKAAFAIKDYSKGLDYTSLRKTHCKLIDKACTSAVIYATESSVAAILA